MSYEASPLLVPFGKGSLCLPRRGHATEIILRRTPEALVNAQDAIRASLRRPVQAKALRDEALGKSRVCIVVCDATRPVPNAVILPPLLDELAIAGVRMEQVEVLIATGLHRPSPREEWRALLGEEVLARVAVTSHDARREEEHDYVMTTPRGVDVFLNRRFLSADLRILVGMVEPHYVAGYSGGRKLIAPGVAGATTIASFHNAEMMTHPGCRIGNVSGNPLHEEQLSIVGHLGTVSAINVMLTKERALAFVNYGSVVESHLDACAVCDRHAVVPVAKRYRSVIASSGGSPLDATFYQAVKAMVTGHEILEPGGDLVVLAECADGIGSDEYVDSQRKLVELGAAAYLRQARERKRALIDEWQTVTLARLLLSSRIHLWSSDRMVRCSKDIGVHVVTSLGELERRIPNLWSDSVAVIPEGPYVSVVLRE